MADKTDKVSLKCDPCGKKFISQNDLTQHLQTKKHHKQAGYKNDLRCGVYITGFRYNKSKEDVLQYFSKFGGIKKSLVGPTMSYVIIVYEKEEEAIAVLSRKHYLDGRTLRVEKRHPSSLTGTEDQDRQIHERLIQSLESDKVFDNQIKKFVQLMTPNLQQISVTYNYVNVDVQRALYGYFQYYQIVNFGSSITSTQFNSSDLDIYVDFMEKPASIEACLKIIRSALSRSRRFHNIIIIPSAKVPIVRFIHTPTGMKGDINFVNKLGVMNSKFIAYYLSFDCRLRHIMLVIKYWAKVHEISGRNHLFTSYSMVMMFIFYLQQRYSFPSVRDLQYSTNPTDPEVIWNMNINPVRDTTIINRIKSVGTLEILEGFFEYYSNFEFDSRIICPYLGKTVPKDYFKDIETVPEEFHLYKTHIKLFQPLDYGKPVCLQDPFELNVNTCRIIFGNILQRFVAANRSAAIILSNEQENMLIKLFSFVDVPVVYTPKIKIKQCDDPDTYTVCLKQPSDLNYLKSDSGSDLTEMWFEHTLEYCHKLFEKVLRLELKRIDNSKCARVSDQRDVHDCDNIERFHATSYVNVWACRNVNPELKKGRIKDCETSLEQDIAVSAMIWEGNIAVRPTTPIFECKIILTCLKEPSRINIEFTRMNSYKKIYKSFGLYIKSKIPQWFFLNTKELNEQNKSKELKANCTI